jgi:hypothetical protein
MPVLLVGMSPGDLNTRADPAHRDVAQTSASVSPG